MTWTLATLATRLGLDWRGAPQTPVVGLCEPQALQAGQLALILDARRLAQLPPDAAGVLLLSADLAEQTALPCLLAADPRAAFAAALDLFYPQLPLRHSISPQACIDPNARLAEPVEIGPFAVIEAGVQIGPGTRIGPHCVLGAGSVIGPDCRLGPRVVLGPQTQMGERVIIHAGTVIGADGYGFYKAEGRHHKIPQVGRVEIADDVEIGALVAIDRATLGQTRIGEGTKIDNLVQIGHNVQIGKHCLLVAQVGIAGSTVIGDHVTLAGQTGVAGHLHVGDGVVAAGKSGITRDIPPGQRVAGYPAQPMQQEFRERAALRRLPRWLRAQRDPE
ncbi:MAG: UDP-3-O-(3-hydroxymyristoyl)glucosamine N-acyltransferase [Candidatus Sericytochromatia bacterium]|nr:UDP-3-O-(3-hydroxymyristoyl)glucosamine N-acyltransferase [Candidatus Sericytochromatia bacterium]